MSVRAYLFGIAFLVAALVALEATRPRPLDMTIRLERSGSAPFDAEVFFESLPEWLGQPVTAVGVTPFERLEDSSVTGQTYLFLSQTFAPDPVEAERLLAFVARGNTVFVAAQDIEGAFADTLGRPDPDWGATGISTRYPNTIFDPFGDDLGGDTLRLVSPGVEGVYAFPVNVRRRRLVGLDAGRSEVLGAGLDASEPTLARISWGEGDVIVSATPVAFTNAALTGEGQAPAYVAAVLAALPD
ncbi:DUF4350 domain-containing protein, partial [Rubrivirga sp.]|uniref:DUF4350 domain-containing protein n=1 Tax=Rubrivirga sp. TaxID=1885344 RepID=UPI003C73357B